MQSTSFFVFLSGAGLPDGPFLYTRPQPEGDERVLEHWLADGAVELEMLRDGYLIFGMTFKKLVPDVRFYLEEKVRVIALSPCAQKSAVVEDRARPSDSRAYR